MADNIIWMILLLYNNIENVIKFFTTLTKIIHGQNFMQMPKYQIKNVSVF